MIANPRQARKTVAHSLRAAKFLCDMRVIGEKRNTLPDAEAKFEPAAKDLPKPDKIAESITLMNESLKLYKKYKVKAPKGDDTVAE